MASAIRGQGAYYDTRPQTGHRFGGPIGGLFGFASDGMRGACAGLLALLGGIHLTGGAAPMPTVASGFEPFAALAQQFATSGFAGPAELIGGVVLFLTARRAIARTLGLLFFIGFLVAHANGYTLADMLTVLSSLFENAAGVLDQAAARQTA